MSRLCLVCGTDISQRDSQALYCLCCYQKANRRNGAERAHQLVAKEIKAGRLPAANTQSCVDCGGPAKHYDHRDYNKPLDVVPVCPRCNKLRGPAIALGGKGLFTSKQSKFVEPNWHEPIGTT